MRIAKFSDIFRYQIIPIIIYSFFTVGTFVPFKLSAQVSMTVNFSDLQHYLNLPFSLQSLNLIAPIDYLSVTNNSNTVQEVYFKGNALKDNVEVFRARSSTIQLNPGETKGFNKTSYQQLYNLPGSHIEFIDSHIEDAVRSTGYLPNGNYYFCIFLYSESNILIQKDCSSLSKVDVNQTGIQNTKPFDGDTIHENLPLFVWTPLASGKQDVHYDLFLYELLDDKSNYATIKSVPEWYKIEGIKNFSIQYSPSHRALRENQGYTWYVVVKNSINKSVAQSEPTSFVFRNISTVTTSAANTNRSNRIYFNTEINNIYTLSRTDSIPVMFRNISSCKFLVYKIKNSSGELINKGILPVSEGTNLLNVPFKASPEKISGICLMELYNEKGGAGHLKFQINKN